MNCDICNENITELCTITIKLMGGAEQRYMVCVICSVIANDLIARHIERLEKARRESIKKAT